MIFNSFLRKLHQSESLWTKRLEEIKSFKLTDVTLSLKKMLRNSSIFPVNNK